MSDRELAPDWLSCAPMDVPRVTGVPMDRVRRAIQAGDLEVLYPSPKRQVVTRDALLRWLASMPTERASA